MRIYVASSWRNELQPDVVKELRKAGHGVYDFRHPAKDDKGFHWGEISKGWKQWKPRTYVESLEHPVAVKGFEKDMDALRRADMVVLVLPCGTSAHLEAGFIAGERKTLVIYYEHEYMFPTDHEPELMYKMASGIVFGMVELKLWVKGHASGSITADRKWLAKNTEGEG